MLAYTRLMAEEPPHRTNSDSGGQESLLPRSYFHAGSGSKHRGRYTTGDFIVGNIPRHLWYLVWPQTIDGFLAVAVQLSELVWVGRLGFQAVAAIGVAQVLLLAFMNVRSGIDAATRALIARSIGARIAGRPNHILLQSFSVTLIFCITLILFGLFFTEYLLGIFGLSSTVAELASTYMKVQYFTLSIASFQMLSAGALQASGNSISPLRADVVGRIIQIVLAPVMIFGWFGMPELGIVGAPVAALFGRLLAVAMNFYALNKGSFMMKLDLKAYWFDWKLILDITRLAIPASVTVMQRGLSQIAFIAIVTPFGDATLAAFATIRRLETTANMFSMGLGRSAGAVGAQNLGAGQSSRAISAFRWAILFGILPSVFIALAFFVYSEQVSLFVASEPEFVDLASSWLSVLALGYVSISVVLIFTHAFNAAGRTLTPMVITLSTIWLFEIPLALILSNTSVLGQSGVPWAIVIGNTLRLVVFTWYFFRGGWSRTGIR
jgi:putative MATE family efflux protein